MLTLVSVYFVLSISASFVHPQRNNRPNVRLNQGFLKGNKQYAESGKIIDSYLGVPYAAAPVGNLRFAPPQRHPGWNGTLDAIEYGPVCPQLPITNNMNENCLFLNIWTPENAVGFGLIPVLIFFEGIEFREMNRPTISGRDMAVEGLVVITVSYRLNVFGFLCMRNSEIRGNFGLIDQYFAMLWVRENIKYFGGDADKMTLFGHSAGGASVFYHMTSPRTAGLFQRAIISSGSALSPWHLTSNTIKPSERIVSILGCSDQHTKNILSCLISKSMIDILKAYEEYVESGNWTDLFLPVVDTFLPQGDQYLPLEPTTALKDGTYMQVPILTGITKPIGDPQYKQWMDLASQGFLHLQQFFEKSKIPELVSRYQLMGRNSQEIIEILRWKYIASSQGDIRILLEHLKNIDFEAKIEAPHFLQLNYFVSSYVQPIYVYYLDDIGFILNTTDTTVTSDLLLLFGPLLLNQVGRKRFNSNELRYSQRAKQLWTNFIIFGNPTINTNTKIWRPYVANDYYIEHLSFSGDSNIDSKSRFERVSFWTHLLPKLASFKFGGSKDFGEYQHSPDPAAGFRHAMYTLVGLVLVLLSLLLICVVLLKKRSKEQERHLHMGY